MQSITIKNVTLGAGRPKICIPNTGQTKEDVLRLATSYKSLPMDLMEWRVDWFEDVTDASKVLDVLSSLHTILEAVPLLFTFRTTREGGNTALSIADYVALNITASKSGFVDLVDIEAFTGNDIVIPLIKDIQSHGVKVIASNHNFEKTPSADQIVDRLRTMQDLGADIPKIAVMPQSKKDVITLLEATECMFTNYATRPIITMSMTGLGSISRVACEAFGSCLTFGAGEQTSAPGQFDAEVLFDMLETLHKAYE